VRRWPEDLAITEASEMIDELKHAANGAGGRRYRVLGVDGLIFSTYRVSGRGACMVPQIWH
jgi:hypothetical protein